MEFSFTMYEVVDIVILCRLPFPGMALLGCDVISTDQIEVLPLLMKNAERNSSRIMQMKPESGIPLCGFFL